MSTPRYKKKLSCPVCDDGKLDAVGLTDKDSDATMGWCVCGAM